MLGNNKKARRGNYWQLIFTLEKVLGSYSILLEDISPKSEYLLFITAIADWFAITIFV